MTLEQLRLSSEAKRAIDSNRDSSRQQQQQQPTGAQQQQQQGDGTRKKKRVGWTMFSSSSGPGRRPGQGSHTARVHPAPPPGPSSPRSTSGSDGGQQQTALPSPSSPPRGRAWTPASRVSAASPTAASSASGSPSSSSGDVDYLNSYLHPVWCGFSRQPELESRYRVYYYDSYGANVRRGIVIGIAIWLALGVARDAASCFSSACSVQSFLVLLSFRLAGVAVGCLNLGLFRRRSPEHPLQRLCPVLATVPVTLSSLCTLSCFALFASAAVMYQGQISADISYALLLLLFPSLSATLLRHNAQYTAGFSLAFSALFAAVMAAYTDCSPAALAVGVLALLCCQCVYVQHAYRETVRNRREFLSFCHLQQEEELNQRLLLKMLPLSIIGKLRSGAEYVWEKYDCVSVLFSHIDDFDVHTAAMQPLQLVRTLNRIFSMFDALTDEHGVYKVETIGDVFLVSSGCPAEYSREDHAAALCRLALDMMSVVKSFTVQHDEKRRTSLWQLGASSRSLGGEDDDAGSAPAPPPALPLPAGPGALSRTRLDLRIGINTGPVIAGVVGVKYPRYRLMGDTINTASRMSTTCQAGEVQLSASTFAQLDAAEFSCQHRHKVEVKGKGTMSTYLLLPQPAQSPHTAAHLQQWARQRRQAAIDGDGPSVSPSLTVQGGPTARFDFRHKSASVVDDEAHSSRSSSPLFAARREEDGAAAPRFMYAVDNATFSRVEWGRGAQDELEATIRAKSAQVAHLMPSSHRMSVSTAVPSVLEGDDRHSQADGSSDGRGGGSDGGSVEEDGHTRALRSAPVSQIREVSYDDMESEAGGRRRASTEPRLYPSSEPLSPLQQAAQAAALAGMPPLQLEHDTQAQGGEKMEHGGKAAAGAEGGGHHPQLLSVSFLVSLQSHPTGSISTFEPPQAAAAARLRPESPAPALGVAASASDSTSAPSGQRSASFSHASAPDSLQQPHNPSKRVSLPPTRAVPVQNGGHSSHPPAQARHDLQPATSYSASDSAMQPRMQPSASLSLFATPYALDQSDTGTAPQPQEPSRSLTPRREQQQGGSRGGGSGGKGAAMPLIPRPERRSSESLQPLRAEPRLPVLPIDGAAQAAAAPPRRLVSGRSVDSEELASAHSQSSVSSLDTARSDAQAVVAAALVSHSTSSSLAAARSLPPEPGSELSPAGALMDVPLSPHIRFRFLMPSPSRNAACSAAASTAHLNSGAEQAAGVTLSSRARASTSAAAVYSLFSAPTPHSVVTSRPSHRPKTASMVDNAALSPHAALAAGAEAHSVAAGGKRRQRDDVVITAHSDRVKTAKMFTYGNADELLQLPRPWWGKLSQTFYTAPELEADFQSGRAAQEETRARRWLLTLMAGVLPCAVLETIAVQQQGGLSIPAVVVVWLLRWLVLAMGAVTYRAFRVESWRGRRAALMFCFCLLLNCSFIAVNNVEGLFRSYYGYGVLLFQLSVCCMFVALPLQLAALFVSLTLLCWLLCDLGFTHTVQGELLLHLSACLLYLGSSFSSEYRDRLTFIRFLRHANEKTTTQLFLANLLPRQIIDSLTLSRQPFIAHERLQADVLFCDVVQFTALAARSCPEDVVAILNVLFSSFDAMTDKYHVYKVETIGDAYLACSGVVDEREDHTRSLVECGLAMRRVTRLFRTPDDSAIVVRIGIHTGFVIAGVVGRKMPRYHLFGETVSIAEEMEQRAPAGQVTISEATMRAMTADQLKAFDFAALEPIRVGGAAAPVVAPLQQTAALAAFELRTETASAADGAACPSPSAASCDPSVRLIKRYMVRSARSAQLQRERAAATEGRRAKRHKRANTAVTSLNMLQAASSGDQPALQHRRDRSLAQRKLNMRGSSFGESDRSSSLHSADDGKEAAASAAFEPQQREGDILRSG